MSRIVLISFSCLVVLALVLGGVYWYWTTTPLYAFQEAALSVKEHDSDKFGKYVDSRKLVDSALNDVLIHPIEAMPGLSEIGRRVAVAAISVSAGRAEATLLRQIDNYVSGARGVSSVPIEQMMESPYTLVSYNTSGDLGSVLSVTRREVTGEFDRFRTLAYERMQNYAVAHQQGLVGRLFIMAKDPRQANVSGLLTEYGLVPENCRGLAYCNTTDNGTGENCKTGVKFASPKVGHDVVLEIELIKSAGNWQVVRLSNLESLIEELDPTYASDFQALIQSSVRGINSQSAKKQLNALTKRIGESDAFKRFLRSRNFR